MSILTREQFRNLIGQVRANGAFPDEPLLAVYDTYQAQLAELEQALRLHLAVSPNDPLVLTTIEHEVVQLRQQLAQADVRIQDLEASGLAKDGRLTLLEQERDDAETRNENYRLKLHQRDEQLAASKTGTCLKCKMGPLRESCAYPEACEHPGRDVALQLNRTLLDLAMSVARAKELEQKYKDVCSGWDTVYVTSLEARVTALEAALRQAPHGTCCAINKNLLDGGDGPCFYYKQLLARKKAQP